MKGKGIDEIRSEMCKFIFLSVTSIGMKATRYFAPVGMKKVITFEYVEQIGKR